MIHSRVFVVVLVRDTLVEGGTIQVARRRYMRVYAVNAILLLLPLVDRMLEVAVHGVKINSVYKRCSAGLGRC